MSKRKGGSRRRTRGELTKPKSLRGKLSIRRYMAVYNEGDKVVLKLDPTSNEGTFHARFTGKAGTIAAKRGNCYEIRIKDFTKPKMLLVHPIHLKKC
ncbi:50S ribosomal protein L21e [Candidatus Woesearchaeota archaeon]|nr:50S ribosomal protein L21e [Candidatus Woesearchaeota archaeon]